MPPRLTLRECQEEAERRGGKCLDDQYTNAYTIMLWKCSNPEHPIFQLNYHTIKHDNSWCPECNTYNKPLTIDIARDIAIQKGGRCLSHTYKNNRTLLQWECSEGHTWKAPLERVKNRGDWCPTCAGNQPQTIDECYRIAALKNGKCLANVYVNSITPVLWECEFGHRWNQATGIVKSGHWCSHCYGNAKHTIEECRETAVARGGKCLSDSYINSDDLISWECKEKHQWFARYNNIKNMKQWCPMCGRFKSEKIARQIIEETTGFKFNKIRPDWLLYDNGVNLELDGYNEKERIAFEYHGKQHYEEIDHFHRYENDFKLQQERDAWKEAKCKEEKVDLIVIPYTYNYNDPDSMRQFIEVELAKIYTARGKSSDIDGYSVYPEKIQCFACNQTIQTDVLEALKNYPNCCANPQCSNTFVRV